MIERKSLGHTIIRKELVGKSAFFKVRDGYYKDVKDVHYNGVKDLWSCTCFYWSIKQKTCSHILKCKGELK